MSNAEVRSAKTQHVNSRALRTDMSRLIRCVTIEGKGEGVTSVARSFHYVRAINLCYNCK